VLLQAFQLDLQNINHGYPAILGANFLLTVVIKYSQFE